VVHNNRAEARERKRRGHAGKGNLRGNAHEQENKTEETLANQSASNCRL
jgi:hypothetical protein